MWGNPLGWQSHPAASNPLVPCHQHPALPGGQPHAPGLAAPLLPLQQPAHNDAPFPQEEFAALPTQSNLLGLMHRTITISQVEISLMATSAGFQISLSAGVGSAGQRAALPGRRLPARAVSQRGGVGWGAHGAFTHQCSGKRGQA